MPIVYDWVEDKYVEDMETPKTKQRPIYQDGPGVCMSCGKFIQIGFRHYYGEPSNSCDVSEMLELPSPVAEEPETEEDPEPAIPTHRCSHCGDLHYDGDPLFDGMAVTSRWMVRNGKLSHACSGYGAEPHVAVEVDIWA